MLLSPHVLCLLGLVALGTVHATPWAEEKMDQGNCPMFWSGFNGRCYKYIHVYLSWNEAQRHCQVAYSHPELISELPSIRSQEENDFVRSLIPEDEQGDAWIGLNDYYAEGRWMWPDGSRADYTPWAADQPYRSTSYNCVYTSKKGEWHAMPCSNSRGSLCVLRKQLTSC